MSLVEVLLNKSSYLNGRLISDDEVSTLLGNFPSLNLMWLVDIMLQFPIIGCEFNIKESLVSMEWMTPQQMMSEATEFYPGIAAVSIGYFPVGECLEASGDPYFIQVDTIDSKLLRIPHYSVDNNGFLIEDHMEMISQTLSLFFENAQVS